MNVQNGYGAIHHLVEATRRVLCGDTRDSLAGRREDTSAALTCPACVRMLADDARLAAPRTHDSED